MKLNRFILSCFIITLCFSLFAQTNFEYPVKLTPENHFLTDQKGTPFFWSGDAAWSLIVQLSREDAEFYLDNRLAKGFNMLMVNLIEHRFCTNAPNNFYNEPPFTGKMFTTPNEKYFAHADYVIRSAAKRGIIVLLFPMYLGYDCGIDGWCEETRLATTGDLRFYGQYLGERYRGYTNIIWCAGGDTDPSQVRDKMLACIRGIREKDSSALFSSHNQSESFAVSPWSGESWLTINNLYSYSTALYEQCRDAYLQCPVMPYFMIESAYENEHQSSAQRLRSQAYWPVLCGAMGYIFGNCPLWHFGGFPSWCGKTDWKAELDAPGSVSMDMLQRLFRSRPWYALIPDFDHKVLLSGYGTWGKEDYATASRAQDGSTIVAYLPSARPVVFDMTKISGNKAICWWYNPRTGEYTEIGAFETKGTHEFIPTSDEDWVIVLDDASMGFCPAGKNK